MISLVFAFKVTIISIFGGGGLVVVNEQNLLGGRGGVWSMSKISFQNRKLLNDHPPPPKIFISGRDGGGGQWAKSLWVGVVNEQKASFQNMKPKVR